MQKKSIFLLRENALCKLLPFLKGRSFYIDKDNALFCFTNSFHHSFVSLQEGKQQLRTGRPISGSSGVNLSPVQMQLARGIRMFYPTFRELN